VRMCLNLLSRGLWRGRPRRETRKRSLRRRGL
jgi:hypothetical protein